MSKIVASKNGSKKDVIVQKAATLFRKKGFAGASMRELAESMGVEASSLYNHIGSKAELLHAICFRVAQDFTRQLNSVSTKGGKVLPRVEEVIRFHIHMMLDQFDEVYVANHEWKQLGEPALAQFLEQRKTYESKLVHLVEEGIQQNEIKGLNAHVVVLTILSALRGLEFWQRQRKIWPSAAIEQHLIDQLINGIIK
jgi:AcrR family transcriptional regulator